MPFGYRNAPALRYTVRCAGTVRSFATLADALSFANRQPYPATVKAA